MKGVLDWIDFTTRDSATKTDEHRTGTRSLGEPTDLETRGAQVGIALGVQILVVHQFMLKVCDSKSMPDD